MSSLSTSISDALASSDIQLNESELNKKVPKDNAEMPSMDKMNERLDYLKRRGEETQSVLEHNQKERESLSAIKPPELTPVPEAPKEKTPWDKLNNLGVGLTFLGTALAKLPMQNSFDAVSGIIDSWNKKDSEKAKIQYDIWKANTDNALKLYDYQSKVRSEDLKRLRDGDESAIKDYREDALAVKDFTSAKVAESKDINMILQHEDRIAKVQEDLRKSQEKYDHQFPFYNKIIESLSDPEINKLPIKERAELYKKLSDLGQKGSDKKVISDEDYKKFKELPEIVGAAESLHEGMMSDPTLRGMGANAPQREAAMRLFHEKYPEDNLATNALNYKLKQKEISQFANTDLQLKSASNLLDSSLPSLLDAAKQYGISDKTDLNKIRNFYQQHMSDPAYNNFRSQLRAVISDYAILTGRGKQTVHSDDEAMKILNDSMGLGSLEGFKRAATTEMKNISAANEKTKQGILGQPTSPNINRENKEIPSQEDLEYTAKTHGMTVDEVKKRLGL